MTRNIHNFIISDGEKVGVHEQLPVATCCDIKTGNSRDVEQFLCTDMFLLWMLISEARYTVTYTLICIG